MTRSEEAKFYLKQCRVSRLDGDRDGVPCESYADNKFNNKTLLFINNGRFYRKSSNRLNQL